MELFLGKQLFIDDFAIEEMSGLKRVLNQPVKHPNNPCILTQDKPWEKAVIIWPHVFYDEEKKRFKMLYIASDGEKRFTCYAESSDGVNWKKPNLGIAEYKGSKENNIVPIAAGKVFWDPHEKDPEKRFKMGIWNKSEWIVHYSADGVNWNSYPPVSRLQPFGFGAPRSMWGGSMNPDANYVVYHQRGSPRRTRVMGRMESNDYLLWSEIRTVIDADLQDPLDTEFDHMTVDPSNRTYAGLHIGMLQVFHMDITEDVHSDSKKFWEQSPHAARLDAFLGTQLAVSRDTIKWQRWLKPFIPRGEPGSWDWGCVYGNYPIIHENMLYFYYVGSEFTHGGRTPEIWKSPLVDKEKKHAHLRSFGLATLRLDGFVSVEPSGYGEGVLTTNRFRWEKGTSVYVNVDASHGELKTELVEDTGRTIPSFTVDDSDPVREDVLDRKITWKGVDSFPSPDYARIPDLGVHDWYVKLRFHLCPGTKLYSFTVTPPEVFEWQGWETEKER